MDAATLKQLIFKCDPYDGFDVSRYELDKRGWFDNEASFEVIFDLIRPVVTLELGVWYGESLRWTAQKLNQLHGDPLAPGAGHMAIGVDTWLGSVEHWDSSENAKTRFGALNTVNGYPQFYYQFLANTVISGLQDTIVPFPTTSLDAMRYLKKYGIKADVIFVDGSHSYPDVYNDLTAAKDLLRGPDSVLIGDDLSPWFPDVAKSVKHFREENPGWKLIKDGFGFLLLHPDSTLDIRLPKRPPRQRKNVKTDGLV